MSQLHKPNELYLQRLYDAPLQTVWDAWTDPQQAAHWWGPRGFTITTKSKDFKTGGSWVYIMHGPHGVDYPNHTSFIEVQNLARMVYDHGSDGISPPMFRVTAVFTPIGKQTKVDMTMVFENEQVATQTQVFIKQVGGNATWDRLAEYLAKQQDGKEIFVINRSFDVSIDQMYAMWTEPTLLSKWLAPNGTFEFMRADIRQGGSTFSVMKHGEQSPPLFGRANYIELNKPHRIVYTQQFCDDQENVVRHPMSPTWPLTKLTTVTFTAEAEHQTRVTIQWEPFGDVSQQEMDTFTNARAGMTMGWTGSLDGLEALVKTVT
jgi:uncharacterized protein YndB with AHSA1/START domain